MRKYAFIAPESVQDLFAKTADKADMEIRYLAGGTDLVGRMNLERDEIPYEEKKPMLLVSLAGLGLKGITEAEDTIEIGACTTIAEIQKCELIRSKAAALAEAADVHAGYAIRNVATVGGNIMNASPAADTVPALIALDADVCLQSASGERKVKLADFMTGPGKTAIGPGEFLSKIILHPGKGKTAFRKIGRRAAESLSVVNTAAYIEIEDGICKDARIAVGSCAPTVVVCREAAAALIGKKLDKQVISEAMQLIRDVISPIDDVHSTAWYRRETAPVMAARAAEEAAGIAE